MLFFHPQKRRKFFPFSSISSLPAGILHMSQKVEKPVLQGQRIKTRKRDEKEKYDPSSFRDAIFEGFAKAENLEQVSKFLDAAGSKLDYRRYGETLFDILFTGGILAPGGAVVEDGDSNRASTTSVCVFECDPNLDSLKAFVQVFVKLIRRYKYLERAFEDEMKKVLMYTKGFKPEQRTKLADVTAVFLAQGLVAPGVLSAIFQEHLIKEGIGLDFFTALLKTWLAEKEASTVWAALKKAGVETRLMELMPSAQRTQEHFKNHFNEAGLGQVVLFVQNQQSQAVKKELVTSVEKLVNDGDTVKEILQHVKEQQEKLQLPEHELVVLVWSTLMGTVEWNKKEDLVADQALKHLKLYAPLLAKLATSAKSEYALINKVQEYCYENMVFQRVFQKIVLLFYNTEVVSEDTILKWFREAHNTKGKTHFLEQMKKFVEWLENAEEEEEDEEGEEEED